VWIRDFQSKCGEEDGEELPEAMFCTILPRLRWVLLSDQHRICEVFNVESKWYGYASSLNPSYLCFFYLLCFSSRIFFIYLKFIIRLYYYLRRHANRVQLCYYPQYIGWHTYCAMMFLFWCIGLKEQSHFFCFATWRRRGLV